jgi:hypothetical protein
LDADAGWIASVNGEARPLPPSAWDWPLAAAGSAVPLAELPEQADSVSARTARHIARSDEWLPM